MTELPMKLVIWGQEGVGKTSLASLFPDPWFIDTEQSTKWMPQLKNRQFQPYPKTWADVKAHLNMFIQQKPGETLVIDTGDWLEAMLIKDLCNRKNWDGLGGANDFGNSYNVLDSEFREFLAQLNAVADMGINVVVTCHSQTKTFTAPDQMGSWDRYELKLQKKTASALKEWADAIVFMKFKDTIIQTDKNGKKFKAQGGTLRVIETIRTAAWDGKNRFGWPEEMIFDAGKLPDPMVATLAMGHTQAAPAQQTETIEPDPLPFKNKEKAMDPHTALWGLMVKKGVDRLEVQDTVSACGFFPKDTDIEDYPPDFVQTMLIDKWDDFMAKGKELGTVWNF